MLLNYAADSINGTLSFHAESIGIGMALIYLLLVFRDKIIAHFLFSPHNRMGFQQFLNGGRFVVGINGLADRKYNRNVIRVFKVNRSQHIFSICHNFASF